ncbi:hypothetical protein BKA61DRAFT_692551 [Leptodontidium sp. MPI-SDFR-AT-0119]|nr:hypothetical protein BKA61DRAFT_692551 [Leptodontidium sp. MPI-SDFR-AT-0119]
MARLDLGVGPAPDFTGKVVIVTGGTSGIGQSMVTKFAERGANVIISDLNAPSAIPDNSLFIRTDVTSWSSQVKMFQQSIECFGKIDVVCANAGISEGENAFEDRIDDAGAPIEPKWSTIHVNLIGTLTTVKLAIHHMKKTGGGRIVLTSSMSGYDAHGIPVYAASKHGIIGAMRGLRDYLPPLNITINALAPGFTETNLMPSALQNGAMQKLRDAAVDVQGPNTVALAALHFASRADLNGQTLSIVGGRYDELESDLRTAFRNITAGSSSNSERKATGGKGFEVVESLFQVDL